MFKYIVTMALVLSFAHAEWSSVNKVDDFTDKKIKMAIYDGGKHHVQISRSGDDIWMYVSIKTIDQFASDGLIEMRVDKNVVKKIDFKTMKSINKIGIKKVFEWKPSVVAFNLVLLTKGCGYLEEIMNGKELKIRYRTSLDMGSNTFSVPLTNASDTIAKALDVGNCIK